MKKQSGWLVRTAVSFAFAGVVLGALTSPSRAVTATFLGTFSLAACPVSCSGSFGPASNETGSINDFYTFTVTGPNALLTIDSVINNYNTTDQQIQSFTIALFHNSGTTSGPTADGLVSTNTGAAPGAPPGLQTASLTASVSSLLDTGQYFLEVTGTTGTTGTQYSGPFKFEPVATTPLPAALPLFAGGLGVLGFLAKRRKRKASAMAPA